MISTSYYGNRKLWDGKKRRVSIAGKAPMGWKGEEYKKLAPPRMLVTAWKEEAISWTEFEGAYRKGVLSKLDAEEVARDLEGAVLLCYEKPGDKCHRHIVAKWLREELGIMVREETT